MSLDDLLGDSRVDLSEVLSHVLDKGVVLKGEVMLAVADIDLIKLDVGLLLTAVESALGRPRRRSGREYCRLRPRRPRAPGATCSDVRTVRDRAPAWSWPRGPGSHWPGQGGRFSFW